MATKDFDRVALVLPWFGHQLHTHLGLSLWLKVSLPWSLELLPRTGCAWDRVRELSRLMACAAHNSEAKKALGWHVQGHIWTASQEE